MSERQNISYERPRRRTIYSKKEFLSPDKIFIEIDKLRKLKQADYQGLFSTKIRDTFFNDYYQKGITKKKEEMDPNQVISIIYALQDPQQPSGYYPHPFAEEISTLQQILLGKNQKLLEGRYGSDYILPVYVFLRSLREKNSYWLISTFKDMPFIKRKKLKEEVENLFEKITSFFSEDKKKNFLYRFGIDLGWLYQEYKPQENQEEKETGIFLNPIKLGQIEKPKKREGLLLVNRRELLTDDGKIAEYLSSSSKEFLFSDTLGQFINIDFEGNILLSDTEKFSLEFTKFLEEIKERTGYDLKNKENFSIAFIISNFSRITRYSPRNDFWLEENKSKNVDALISSFRDTLKTIFQEEQFIELRDLLKRSFILNPENPDFNLFNQRLLEIIIGFYKKTNNVADLKDFISKRGASELFFALRNLFFLKLIHNEINKLNLFSYFSQPNIDLLFKILQPLRKELLSFRKDNRISGNFGKICFREIIDLGFYFAFEKLLFNFGKIAVTPLEQKGLYYSITEKGIKYDLPPGVSLSKINYLDFQGIKIPYRLEDIDLGISGSTNLKINVIPLYKDDVVLDIPTVEK